MQSSQLTRNGLIWLLHLENLGIDTIFIALACSLPLILGQKGFPVMAALISILLEMPKGDAMSSTGFSIRTTWATRICKEKNFISRIQVQPYGTRTNADMFTFRTTLKIFSSYNTSFIPNNLHPYRQHALNTPQTNWRLTTLPLNPCFNYSINLLTPTDFIQVHIQLQIN